MPAGPSFFRQTGPTPSSCLLFVRSFVFWKRLLILLKAQSCCGGALWNVYWRNQHIAWGSDLVCRCLVKVLLPLILTVSGEQSVNLVIQVIYSWIRSFWCSDVVIFFREYGCWGWDILPNLRYASSGHENLHDIVRENWCGLVWLCKNCLGVICEDVPIGLGKVRKSSV